MKYYILEGKEPKEVNQDQYRIWLCGHANELPKRVAGDYVEDYFVSTVFLGIDHSFGCGGPPIVFETMIFDQSEIPQERRKDKVGEEVFCCRYATWEQAESGHKDALERAKTKKFDD